jgi:hypothetical protein
MTARRGAPPAPGAPTGTEAPPASRTAADAPLPVGVAVLGVVVFCLIAILSGTIEVLLTPLYVGSHIFPVTVVIAVVVNFALPWLVRMVVDWRWAIAAPMICWLVTAIVLGFTNTGGGSVLLPGGGADGYVGLALFFVGTLAGFIGVIRQLLPVPPTRALPAPMSTTGAERR